MTSPHLHSTARIPAFLAAIFVIFGMEHYRAVLVVQMFVDIGTCFLIADLARRMISPRAARVAFLLSGSLSFSRKLCRQRTHRNLGSVLHRAGAGLGHRWT